MNNADELQRFYKNKNILITGHTGFKGSWLSVALTWLGANVTGYSLEPKDEVNLFKLSEIEKSIESIYGDIRNLDRLQETMKKSCPDIVFHLAAQPIVRESYDYPVYTYDVNVMGTVNLLEAVRTNTSVKSVVNVTTDKVYENTEKQRGYAEEDRLDGYDPYANSKSCSELITASYRRSFFAKTGAVGNNYDNIGNSRIVAISTARAGNVIGGGDFAKDRIIPDCVRTALGMNENKRIIVRNPYSIRPYQHVLESLFAYLEIAKKQYEDASYSGAYNVGPKEADCVTTKTLVNLFCEKWGENLGWEALIHDENKEDKDKKIQKHEASFLKLNSDKIEEKLGYKPRWNIDKAVEMTVEWTKCYSRNEDIKKCMENQIMGFMEA